MLEPLRSQEEVPADSRIYPQRRIPAPRGRVRREWPLPPVWFV